MLCIMLFFFVQIFKRFDYASLFWLFEITGSIIYYLVHFILILLLLVMCLLLDLCFVCCGNVFYVVVVVVFGNNYEPLLCTMLVRRR